MENPQISHHHSEHTHEALIHQLFECASVCENCAASCLEEHDVTAMAHCIELDRDCSEICILGAKLLIRDSEMSHEFLAFCEKACRLCAEECKKHDHEHCRICAEECTKCAEACHAHHHGTVTLN